MNQSQNKLINVTKNTTSWHSATGPISIPLTNDYLFRAMLQRNNKVLKGLISSLLKLSPDKIHSVIITNPILLGEAISDKEFFLDIALILNDNTLINLELQVINEHNWPERSLCYLCRTYDQLVSGEKYHFSKSAIQIGILDFTLFPEHPEFYATYKLLNIKNHSVYSDKLQLSVLNLNRIDLATKEDIACGLDHWAALFKSNTWEELKMLAKNDDFINEAAETIYQLSSEERVRLQCEAREEFYRRQRTAESRERAMKEELSTTKNELDSTKEQLSSAKDELSSARKQLSSKDAEIASLKARIAQLNKQ